MYGTRAHIGLLVPSDNTIIEPEFYALKPAGVSVHSARMFVTGISVGELQRMNQDAERAAEQLATARPSVVAFGCTLASTVGGAGFDEELIRKLEELTHAPATTTATAVLRAFGKLGIHKIVIGTPYSDEMNRLEAAFFEASGMRILDIKGLDLDTEAMHLLAPEQAAKLARDVNRPDADCVFLSCTNLKTVPIIDQLEKELDKPVLSSNVATFWDSMRLLGIESSISGRGRLLASI